MSPSMESSTSSTSSSEPKTPPFNRNATWTVSPSKPVPETASTRGTATPSSLKKRFASFTRSSGKSVAGTLFQGASPQSTSPLDACCERIERLDFNRGAAGTSTPKPAKSGSVTPHDKSAPASLHERSPRSSGDVFSAPHKTADEINERSPLQRVLDGPNANPLPGHPGNLTAAQTKALHELTHVLRQEGSLTHTDSQTPLYTEMRLLRFLRARQFNVDAARVMYLKALAWKKEVELDRLVREFEFSERDEVAQHGWCMYFHKTDRLGRPIFVQDLGNMDATNVLRKTTPERIIKNFAVTLELAERHRYEACTIAAGRWVDDNYMVVNLAGMGLSTFWTMKGQLQQLLAILDNNFPELSGRVQIINAPYMFSTMWSWVKGWLPVATVEKIDIAGADYHERIWEYVNKEDWPKSLGGECECTGEKGCRKSDLGPWDKRLVRTADL